MSELQRRLAELSDEIRHYPTPIARCDEQLTGLLDQRAALVEQMRESIRQAAPRASGCSPENIWINDGGFNAA
jgi:hypothetical protein